MKKRVFGLLLVLVLGVSIVSNSGVIATATTIGNNPPDGLIWDKSRLPGTARCNAVPELADY